MDDSIVLILLLGNNSVYQN